MIRVSRSIVGEKERAALAAVIDRGYLGMGEETRAFEEELESFIGGSRSVVCVSTGTAAIHVALEALDVGPGDEVLVPSLTYVATYQAIAATGATPVSCEVRDRDCTLDVDDARARLTPRTRVVLPVLYASERGSLDDVYAFAEEASLRVVEDAAHAFGCQHDGHMAGSEGDIVCFSFDGIKNITCGEGGAVVTSDAVVAQRVRDARLLGVMGDTEKRYVGQRSWEFDVRERGFRYHMSDLMASIGRVQLGRFESEFKPARVQLAARYRDALAGHPRLRLLDGTPGPTVPHIFPVCVLEGRRDALGATLLEEECQVGIHYKPNHLLTRFGGGTPSLPVTERLYEELLTLPLHPWVSQAEQDKILSVVFRVLD